MSDWDGLRGCEICGNDTTGRLCRSCAEQEAIDNGADVPDDALDFDAHGDALISGSPDASDDLRGVVSSAGDVNEPGASSYDVSW